MEEKKLESIFFSNFKLSFEKKLLSGNESQSGVARDRKEFLYDDILPEEMKSEYLCSEHYKKRKYCPQEKTKRPTFLVFPY